MRSYLLSVRRPSSSQLALFYEVITMDYDQTNNVRRTTCCRQPTNFAGAKDLCLAVRALDCDAIPR
jgi:hypothetical protein